MTAIVLDAGALRALERRDTRLLAFPLSEDVAYQLGSCWAVRAPPDIGQGV